MRWVACLLLLSALACTDYSGIAASPQTSIADAAGIPAQPDAGSDAASPTDAGGATSSDSGVADAGPSNDAGVGDAGPGTDAGSADAGPPPATIGTMECSELPALLWSRTLSDGFGYAIAADEDGNLYWLESDSAPHAFLVSADSDGRDRYRIVLPRTEMGRLVVSLGKAFVVQGGTIIEAYDTATGAPSWTLDIAATYAASSPIHGLVDLGNGNLAAAVSNGIFFIDIGTGNVVLAKLVTDDGLQALASDGAGSLLMSGGAATSTVADYFVVDSTGAEQWRQRFDGVTPPTLWLTDLPWLAMQSATGISSSSHYVTVPSPWSWPAWSGWASGTDLIFNLVAGVKALDPINVQVIRDQTVVASGPVPKEISFNGVSAWPFVAGDDGKHLVLVGQSSHSNAGLCFPEMPSTAWVAHVDEQSLTQCPLTGLSGTLWIAVAALTPGHLIVGGVDMINNACGGPMNPFMIAAYAVPGESLARFGWVQREGNRGLGMRKQRR